MVEADLCPACGERRLPVIDPGTTATARCCQACQAVFEIKDGQHLDQDVTPKEEAK